MEEKFDIPLSIETNQDGMPIKKSELIIMNTILNSPHFSKEQLEEVYNFFISSGRIEIPDFPPEIPDYMKGYLLFCSGVSKYIHSSSPNIEKRLVENTENVSEFEDIIDNLTKGVFSFFSQEKELEQERKAREEAEEKVKEAQAKAEEERKAREKAEAKAKAERKAREQAEKRKSTSLALPYTPLDILSHNNTKLANFVFKGDMELDQLTLFDVLKPSKRRTEDELTTSCTLSNDFYEAGNIEFSSKPPSPYDKEVYDAISSHYEAGNTHLTIGMIYRAMTGKGSGKNAKPSSGQAGAITKSIRKMGVLRAKIDCTNELQARGADIANGKLNSIILEYRALEGEATNGKPFTIYVFDREPILFTYAKAVKQIIPIPMKLLDTPTNNSEEMLVIKKYLLTRILNMKSSHNSIVQNTILLEHIYEQAEANNSNLKRKVRNKIEPFFEYWITLGVFTKYEYISKGQALHSIKFSFPLSKKNIHSSGES